MGQVLHNDGMSPNITKAMAIIETRIGAIAQASLISPPNKNILKMVAF